MTDDSRPIGRFKLEIYHRDFALCAWEWEGAGDEWRQRPSVSVCVDGDSYAVRVADAWEALLAGDARRIDVVLEGLCTIVKFGRTMQLRGRFRVVIELEP